ncbi:MAG: hypothetical protein MI754_12455, partial [Chromatiales bacterium]|nr:hypothetical protein [Chromatiales bacterium]
ENVLMKSIALSQGDSLSRDQLPEPLRTSLSNQTEVDDEKPLTEQSLEDMERIHVKRVLEATAWHKGQACDILGVSRPRLRRMIRQYALIPPNDIDFDADDEA